MARVTFVSLMTIAPPCVFIDPSRFNASIAHRFFLFHSNNSQALPRQRKKLDNKVQGQYTRGIKNVCSRDSSNTRWDSPRAPPNSHLTCLRATRDIQTLSTHIDI